MTASQQEYEQYSRAARFVSGAAWLVFLLAMVCQFFPVFALLFGLSDRSVYIVMMTVAYGTALSLQALAVLLYGISYYNARQHVLAQPGIKKLYMTEWVRLALMVIPVSLLLYIVYMIR